MKNTRKTLKILLSALVAASTLLTLFSCKDNKDKKYTVGICQLVKHDALDAATKGFKDALVAELGEGNVEFIEQNGQNDINVCSTVINDFVTKRVDLILANATAPLQAAANTTLTIPILGTSITEYGTALSIKDFNGTVGGNISGTSDLAPLDKQAAMIPELFPEAKSVALLYCSGEPNSAYQIKVIKDELEKLGLKTVDCPFTDSNDVITVSTKAALEDVIYVPTDNTAAACKQAINGAIGDTPLIAGEAGICSGCGVATLSISYYDLGAATGKMAAKILRGEAKISEMPIAYADKFTKLYNSAKCDQLGINKSELEAKGYTPIS